MQFLKKYVLVYVLIAALFAAGAIGYQKFSLSVFPAAKLDSATEYTVVIDPGHGGDDGGAVSASGLRESELNLQIALQVNDLFHFLGVQTVMTRCEDVSIHDSSARGIAAQKVSDLKNRAALTNSISNAIFLSIHQNMFPEAKYHGAQVFYAPTQGSDCLAEQLQTLLRKELDPDNHREPKPSDGVWLMEHISCTGVLAECGFLSNAEEEQKLKTPAYQKKLSCVLVCGIMEYFTKEAEDHEI